MSKPAALLLHARSGNTHAFPSKPRKPNPLAETFRKVVLLHGNDEGGTPLSLSLSLSLFLLLRAPTHMRPPTSRRAEGYVMSKRGTHLRLFSSQLQNLRWRKEEGVPLPSKCDSGKEEGVLLPGGWWMHVVVYVESTKGMRSGTYKVSKEANVKCGHHELKSSHILEGGIC